MPRQATFETQVPCMKCRKLIYRPTGRDLAAVYCVDCQERYHLVDSSELQQNARRPSVEPVRAAATGEAIPSDNVAAETEGVGSKAPAESVVPPPGMAAKQDGLKNVIFGALWCIGGIVVTAATYQAAANSPGGGSYVVAWGAIVFGGVQFLRGLAQMAAQKKRAEQE